MADSGPTNVKVEMPVEALFRLLEWPQPTAAEQIDQMGAMLASGWVPLPGRDGVFVPMSALQNTEVSIPMEKWSTVALLEAVATGQACLQLDSGNEAIKATVDLATGIIQSRCVGGDSS